MRTLSRQLVSLLVAAFLSAGCSQNSSESQSPAASQAQLRELTVLLASDSSGSWPTGLDPAHNVTGGANLSIMNAIFGGLFQLTSEADGSNPRIVGILASGYEMTDEGRTLLIRLRPGVKFSDGTPLDASAVRLNVERALDAACACLRWPWRETDRVTTPDELTVALHFRQPYPAIINTLPASSINWPASPAAIAATPADQFKLKPIGAGPFRIVSNEISSRLVLERNPLYLEEGRPLLDRLVFVSIGSEQAAYLSLLAGDAHVAEGLSSTSLIAEAMKNEKLKVTHLPPTSPYVVQLNTRIPPLNDKRVREALYYATDTEAIRHGIFNGWYPASQSFTAPGGLFHHETVPGYRTFDLEKARALVKEVGKVKLKLGTIKSAVAIQVITALQSQWKNAGIDVEIETYELATLVSEFRSAKWMAMLQTAGSYDPDAASGVSARFLSSAILSGVNDPKLDKLILQAAETTDPAKRDALYAETARYISDQAYAPFILAFAPAQVMVKGVEGPGLSTKIPPILLNTGVLWHEVRRVAD
jgi:peptide/nickel transport system substrate-binding protein